MSETPAVEAYNDIAGRSIERLAALSDGVFAVAMTLLVLDLRVPVASAIHSEGDLWRALTGLAPHLLDYLMSVMTLGIFWLGQQAQLSALRGADRNLCWIHIVFLLAITMVPFSTMLLAEFMTYRLALVIYWLNILVLGGILLVSWRYVTAAQLVRDGAPQGLAQAVERRIVGAQVLYALGAALSTIGTYWSVGFILLVQLNFVLAPKWGQLKRI
jgi:uncharacterized membrane protein